MTRRLFKAEPGVSGPTMEALAVGVRLGSAAVVRGPFVGSGASGVLASTRKNGSRLYIRSAEALETVETSDAASVDFPDSGSQRL